jgi:hypothetical protein
MLVNASFKWPAARVSGQDIHWPPTINKDLNLEGHESIWVPAIKEETEPPGFITTTDLAALGRAVG